MNVAKFISNEGSHQVSLAQVSENIQTFMFKKDPQTLNRMIGVNYSYFVSRSYF